MLLLLYLASRRRSPNSRGSVGIRVVSRTGTVTFIADALLLGVRHVIPLVGRNEARTRKIVLILVVPIAVITAVVTVPSVLVAVITVVPISIVRRVPIVIIATAPILVGVVVSPISAGVGVIGGSAITVPTIAIALGLRVTGVKFRSKFGYLKQKLVVHSTGDHVRSQATGKHGFLSFQCT